MKTQNYLQIVLLGIVLIFLFSCKKETSDPPDTLPPDEVTNLTAIEGNGKITMTWTDPADVDFQKVEITYLSNTIEVNKGVQTNEIIGLTNGTSYSFTVKTIDNSGNKSSGLQISSTPVSPPALTWSNYIVASLNPSSGIVAISTDFTNIGSSGIINFNSSVTRLSDNTITSNISNSFNVQPNGQYKITLTCNGSATKTSCTVCSPSNKFKIETISLIDNQITLTYIGINCSSLHDCGFWMGSDETEWNSIAVTNMIIEKIN
ncbi:MAG: DUF4959 domain-containing protein [Salinivirgaceae bacterium]